ncbi:MAG TPA: hypothetical protein VEX35_11515 [Allosphingosinicella sp.]|nr:hypothetical protein [Allosphingosinicella sp.]
MARWPSLLLAAAMLATPLALSARGPAPVDPAALAQGALACRGIPDEMAGAERRIVELGWPRHRQRNGEQLPVFERDGMLVMLTPPDQAGHPLACGVMATVRRSVSAADLAAAVSAAFGRQPGPGDAGGFPVWELDGGQVVAVARNEEGGVMFTFWYPRTAPH